MKRNIILTVIVVLLVTSNSVMAQPDGPDYDLRGKVTSGGGIVETNSYRLSSAVGVPPALAEGDYVLFTSSFLSNSAPPDNYEPRGYLPVILSGHIGPPPRD